MDKGREKGEMEKNERGMIGRREEVREKLEMYLEMKRKERENHKKRLAESRAI